MRTIEQELNYYSSVKPRETASEVAARTYTSQRTMASLIDNEKDLFKTADLSNRFSYQDVSYIVDADTFSVKGIQEDIRLYGADAPETSFSDKRAQYRKYGFYDKADNLKGLESKADFFGNEATKITEKYFSKSQGFSLIEAGTDAYGRKLYDVRNQDNNILSVELIRQGGAFTSLPGDRYFQRDSFTQQRLDAYVEAMENEVGIFSRDEILTPEYTRYLKKVKDGERPYQIVNENIRQKLKAYKKSRTFGKAGLTNVQYQEVLGREDQYFTISASRGTSEHYQQSLYENMMRQGGYNNLARSTPFQGIAESLVRTNTSLLYNLGEVDDREAGAATIFLAQQFDKGLYTSGAGEYLNNKLFIPNGFGRAYKDDKGFISSVAGFAGRMLDESYLYYSNITPDVQLIGNEYEEGIGLNPMTADRTGLFESTFTRAAEYTVAMAQSLGMYVAITQPIEMLKASVYKNALDSQLTSASRFKTSNVNSKWFKNSASDLFSQITNTFFFGDLDGGANILERMFEVDSFNNEIIDLGDSQIKRKQTAFFDHNQHNKTGFAVQQFLSRGRAEVMLNATFKPLLQEIINPYDISAINSRDGSSYYKSYNKAVEDLIDSISAPAGLAAQFDPGRTFTFKGGVFSQEGVDDFELILKGGVLNNTIPADPNNRFRMEEVKVGSKTTRTVSINLGTAKDPLISEYPELQRQYTEINSKLTGYINHQYEAMISAKSVSQREIESKKLAQLLDARKSVKGQLANAFELMSLESTGVGVSRKRGIAKALQGVLDYTPINPFKWGILSGGRLADSAGTVMIGQLFSFEDTARMAEAAVTGDNSLNTLFRQAQETKLAELREETINGEEVRRYIRTYNVQDTIHASMKTFDNLNSSVFKSIKDFIFQDSTSHHSIISRASRQLRIAEQNTVAKKGFWQQVSAGFFGDYSEIDASAIQVDKTLLKVKKNGTHILNAVAQYDAQLMASNGIGLEHLEKHLDDSGIRRLMRTSGEQSIQKGINKILQGKANNLSVEAAMNTKAKGIIAGLVFASVVGNSIFQSTGGASLVSQAMFSVAGEKADIAIEFEGNRFLPTEMFHTAIGNVFGAAPSLLALNTASEIGFIAGSTYIGYKLAQYHTYYETLQYSYSLEDIKTMGSKEHIKIFKKTKNALGVIEDIEIPLDDINKATKEIALHSFNRGKLYIETLSTNGAKAQTKVVANGTADILSTHKITQAVVKDVPINTMIYASVAMLAVAGLREIAASTLQLMSKAAPDQENQLGYLASGMGGILGASGLAYLGTAHIKRELVDSVLRVGDIQKRELDLYTKTGKLEKAETAITRINKRIERLKESLPDPNKIIIDPQKNFDIHQEIKRLEGLRGRQRYILDRPIAYDEFLKTAQGVRYSKLTDPSNLTSSLLKKIDPTIAASLVMTAGIITAVHAITKETKELDYAGSLDPLAAGAVGFGLGTLLTRSPAVGLAVAGAAGLGAYVANWAGFKVFKIGRQGETVDGDKARMIAQLAQFTSAVNSNIDEVNTFTIGTSAYVSRFSNLGDKGIYGRGENPLDKTRVIAKQVPLPMLQFFVAEKISGDYSTGVVEGLDNQTTQRIYSVGMQSGALFGMSMSLQLPVMYTPGRGFAGFSYNPDHNLDKLPNALATLAAYTNVYFGTMAALSGLGAALPGGMGETLKNFSGVMGDFNRGVQSLTRNVNGFYIEQVSRTFTKLNLIDTQLLLQSVGDKVFEESRLKIIQEETSRRFNETVRNTFKVADDGTDLRLYDAKGNLIEGDDLDYRKLSIAVGRNEFDEVTTAQLRQIDQGVRANYYKEANLNVVEEAVANKRMGVFGTEEISSVGKNRAAQSLKYLRGNSLTLVKVGIIGATLTNLIGTAFVNSTTDVIGGTPEDILEANIKLEKWEEDKKLKMALGAVGAGALYTAAIKSQSFASNVINQSGPAQKVLKHVDNRSGLYFGLAVAGATLAYNLVKTSSKFGIARYMDKNIKYANDGSGVLKDEEGNILYERNLLHQATVATGLTAYTLGTFALAGGPSDSFARMSQMFYEDYEGKTPTSIAGKVWKTMAGEQRLNLAKVEIEDLLRDVSRLQFNDVDEFKAFHNIQDGPKNPLNMNRLKEEIKLYELKETIRKNIAQNLNIDPKDVPKDYIHKYLGIHRKVKDAAAKSKSSLIDATRSMSVEEAADYQGFMRGVSDGIQKFGTSNGSFLSRRKFTRRMSKRVGVTLTLLATTRVVLQHLDNASADELGRPGGDSYLDRLFNWADYKGTMGQDKIDGTGKVGFLEGIPSALADMARIVIGRDKVDLGIIAETVNKRTGTTNIQRQSLIGKAADLKASNNLIGEVGAGFVFDDSNAYLQLGSFGGITFRTGDKGFRTSSYFQLQSAGQDISTAAYTMAAKFYHKTVAGQGVELSNLIDVSTRLLKDDNSVRNLNRTAVLIRNITSMETPISKVRRASATKGSIQGDKLANVILAAREEAGRQMRRQSLSSLYTENFFTQTDTFKNQVGGAFFRDFLQKVSTGNQLANDLLGEILGGAYGYNPGQRNIISSIIFFSGDSGKIRKNQKGENLMIDDLEGVNLTYQNSLYEESQSKLAEYASTSISALVNQGALNFLPDFVKQGAAIGLVSLGAVSLLSMAGSYASSRQFADDIANINIDRSPVQLTAHWDDGRAVNASKEMVDQMNKAKAQMGEELYSLSEAKPFGANKLSLQYITEGGTELEAILKESLNDPANANKSVNQILNERTVHAKTQQLHNRAVITATNLNSNTSYRFSISETIQFAANPDQTLEDITDLLSKNQNYHIINSDNFNDNYAVYLTEKERMAREFTSMVENGEIAGLKSNDIKTAFYNLTDADSATEATSSLNRIVKDRLMSTYKKMAHEIYGGGFNADGTIDYTKNRFTKLVKLDAGDLGINLPSVTMYEMLNGSFSDLEIISELRTNSTIAQEILKEANAAGGSYKNIEELLGETQSLNSIGEVNAKHIETARQSIVEKTLIGKQGHYGVEHLTSQIEHIVDTKLASEGISIDVVRGRTEITITSLKGRQVIKAGEEGFESVLTYVTHLTNSVLKEVESNQLFENASNNMGVLQHETANQSGFIQRQVEKLKASRTKGRRLGAGKDVAQFRTLTTAAKGFDGLVAGIPAFMEAQGILTDSVAALNIYGAYARFAEALTDPFQTQSDVEMARKELGKAAITSITGVLLSFATVGLMSGAGLAWTALNMTVPKAIAAGLITGIATTTLYKGVIRPAMQATNSLLNESQFLKEAGDAWNNTWNVISDTAGYILGVPVELANKYGVQVFGKDGGKKATFTVAGGLGGGLGVAGILAGLALSSLVTLTAPVSLGLIGLGILGGSALGFVFGDKNATVSTKLLNEIPKIPFVGWILGGMINSPYRSIREEERFKHHYQNSPFTVGFAGDVVNQKWLAKVAAADDPTGADLVSNMFGEIIRPTEYETSAWKINSSSYGSNPIPIVDEVIQRELRIRAQIYADNSIGRYQWNQILKNSDQNQTVRNQIRQQKARETEMLRKARQSFFKTSKHGGASDVPNYPGGSSSAQNNLAANMKLASAELATEVVNQAEVEVEKVKNTKFTVATSVKELNNPLEDFTKGNLKKVVNGGDEPNDIPGLEKTLITARVVANESGMPTISVVKAKDFATGVVRDSSINAATEGQPPTPEQYSQGRVAVMNAQLV